MIYTIVGTHKERREKGHKELASLGAPTHHIYSEQVSGLEALIDGVSLFGDVSIVTCIQLGEVASSKEEMIRLLDNMKESVNIFIIDEPFADVHLFNKLSKVSVKVIDAREEKLKDTSVFGVCDAFIKRDKKTAWIAFMDIREKVSGESLHGALWWKFQTEWSRVKEGKKSLFSEDDCEKIGGSLVRMSITAHRGESDLLIDIEKLILSV
jgi:hypothetical protein